MYQFKSAFLSNKHNSNLNGLWVLEPINCQISQIKALIFQTAVFIELYFQFAQDKMILIMKFNNSSTIEVHCPEGSMSVKNVKVGISHHDVKSKF